MFEPHEIEEAGFKKSFMGGYNEEEVDKFIYALSGDYKKLYNENIDLKKKLAILAEKVEEYRQQENSIKNAVLYAQKLRDDALYESEARSKEIIGTAEKKAKELIDEVEQKAAALRAEEEKYLAEKIKENRYAIEKENIALNLIKKEVSEFKLRLQELYKAHLKTILSMPDYTEPAPEVKEEPAHMEPAETVVEVDLEASADAVTETEPEEAAEKAPETVEEKPVVDKKKVNLVLDIEDTSELKPVNIDFKINNKSK